MTMRERESSERENNRLKKLKFSSIEINPFRENSESGNDTRRRLSQLYFPFFFFFPSCPTLNSSFP